MKDNDYLPPKGRMFPLTPRHLERANLGLYGTAQLKEIEGEEHYDTIKKYVDNLHTAVSEGWGLYLWGDNSVGKTFTSSIILLEALRRGFSCLSISAWKLKEALMDKSLKFDDQQTWLDRILGVHILAIDDIGKEYHAKSGFAEKEFSNILRQRAMACYSSTIITSNLSPVARVGSSEFEEKYGTDTYKLLFEMVYPVKVVGQDQRRKKQNKMQELFGK